MRAIHPGRNEFTESIASASRKEFQFQTLRDSSRACGIHVWSRLVVADKKSRYKDRMDGKKSKTDSSAPRDRASTFIHLDMARAIAALLVVVNHLRLFVFPPWGELRHHNILDVAVWGITSFGHTAVMVFFVLSGFFITRSIMMDDRHAGFTWTGYLIKRLTRLWIVLIPCLMLTLVWDSLAIHLVGPQFYDGQLYGFYNSAPNSTGQGGDLSAAGFFRNLFFLQEIAGTTFGSNRPLWSLANEFWYYILFPLAYLSITRPGQRLAVIVNVVTFAGIAFVVGWSILLYGIIWLLGSLAYFAYERGWFAASMHRWPVQIAAVILLLAALAFGKTVRGDGFPGDAAVGAAAAFLVVVLAHFDGGIRLYRKVARVLAGTSYTIYLAHFPFMALLANLCLKLQKFPNSLTGYSVFFGVGAVTLAYCLAIFWLFERHSVHVRRFFLSRFRVASAGT